MISGAWFAIHSGIDNAAIPMQYTTAIARVEWFPNRPSIPFGFVIGHSYLNGTAPKHVCAVREKLYIYANK